MSGYLYGHKSPIHTVIINKTYNHIVSGSYDRTIKIWHLNPGKLLKNIKNIPNFSLNLTPSGDKLVYES